MGIKLPYGLKDGIYVHIDEAKRGKDCHCICPYCKRNLIAKKGDINENHFAHFPGEDCNLGGETALHLAAKALLTKERIFKIPPLYKNFNLKGHKDVYLTDDERLVNGQQVRETIVKPSYIKINKVFLENRSDDIIPDVIIESQNKRLLIEIGVTHFLNESKIAKIRKQNLPAIEIDLSSLKSSYDEETLKEVVIDGHYFKTWIHNPREKELISKKFNEIILNRRRKFKEKQHQTKSNLNTKRKTQEFYKSYYKPIVWRKTKDNLKVRHIENCPLDKRFFHDQSYANVDSDCKGCKYYRGTKSFKYVVCLYQYFNKA